MRSKIQFVMGITRLAIILLGPVAGSGLSLRNLRLRPFLSLRLRPSSNSVARKKMMPEMVSLRPKS